MWPSTTKGLYVESASISWTSYHLIYQWKKIKANCFVAISDILGICGSTSANEADVGKSHFELG